MDHNGVPITLLDGKQIAKLDKQLSGEGDKMRLYYTFVEDWSDLSRPEIDSIRALDAPDGSDREWPKWLDRRTRRCRTSGLRLDVFERAAQAITPIDHNNVTREERRLRAEMIGEMLKDKPILIIDMFHEAIGKDEGTFNWQSALTPGRWVVLWLIRGLLNPLENIPVWLADPDPGSLEEFSEWTLRGAFAPAREVEDRLRDIFSLVHIPNAVIEENPGDGGGSDPDPDPNPNLKARQLAEHQRMMDILSRPIRGQAYRSSAERSRWNDKT